MEFIAVYSFFSIWLTAFLPPVTVGILLLLIYNHKRKTALKVAAVILFVLAFLVLALMGVVIFLMYSSAQG